MSNKRRAYLSMDPERFEPGTLVVLDRKIFNNLSPGSPGLGLIVDCDREPLPEYVYGMQYTHTVIVEGKLYRALRSTFIREWVQSEAG